VFGGEIKSLDPVRDQLTLMIYGQKAMKILFDERTQAYLDGKKIPLRDLRAEDHASVETMLDGTKVFAVSIRVLSQSPEGEYQGRVLSYNPVTGELSLAASASSEPFRVIVAADTGFTRLGQPEFVSAGSGRDDLAKGSLLSVTFKSGNHNRGVASRIAVLAVPGSTFVFTGNVSSLDLGFGVMVLVDPRDDQSYRVFFDSTSLPSSRTLRLGDHVRVTANYDGTHYVASEIASN
jgi:hypothetical protein